MTAAEQTEEIVGRLAREWDEIGLEWWTGELEGVDEADGYTLAALAELAPTFDHIALALVRAAQLGEARAGRVVLQAMVSRLARLARRHGCTVDELVSAAWVRVMHHPLRRRRAVIVNLCLDSLKAVSRERSRRLRELSLPDLTDLPALDAAIPDTDLRAIDIVDLAERLRLVPPKSVSVLRSVYLDGLDSTSAAERHDTSPDMVRYRCSSAIKTLRSASSTLLGAS